MELTAEQQERYSRHLLLEGLGGEGQERLCQASVRVRGEGLSALWAARSLAAAGVGTLVVGSEAIASECRLLNVDCSVSLSGWAALVVDAAGSSALEGARAALAAFSSIGSPA